MCGPGAVRGRHRLPPPEARPSGWKGREAWGGEWRERILPQPLLGVTLAGLSLSIYFKAYFRAGGASPERGVWLQELCLVWSRAGLLCVILPIQVSGRLLSDTCRRDLLLLMTARRELVGAASWGLHFSLHLLLCAFFPSLLHYKLQTSLCKRLISVFTLSENRDVAFLRGKAIFLIVENFISLK